MAFHNRSDAGRQLASRLHRYAGRSDVVVLALPRGGVPVGAEIARAPRRAARCLPGPQARRAVPPGARDGRHRRGRHRGAARARDSRAGHPAARSIDEVAVARAARARTARRAVPRRPTPARRARPHGHPGRRRPGDRRDDGGGDRRAARAEAGAHRGRGAGRRARHLRATASRLADEVVCLIDAGATSPRSDAWYEDFARRPTKRSASCSPRPAANRQRTAHRGREPGRRRRVSCCGARSRSPGTGSTTTRCSTASGRARVVLLGEATHGTHEFYRERAQITKRLIAEQGLRGRGRRSRLAGRLPGQPLRSRGRR